MTDTLTRPYEVLCEDTSKLERSDWLELRKLGIGSSDAAPIVGHSAWRSEYNVYCDKLDIIAEQPDNKRFRGGRLYEEPTLRWWAEDAGVPYESIQRNVMLRSIEYPWMLANPDGMTDDAVQEVKTAHLYNQHHWAAAVPKTYQFQAMHLMIVSGRRLCIIPVAFDFNGPKEFIVEWDEDLANALIVVEREFWRRVTERDAPDPDGSNSSMAALREQYKKVEKGLVMDLPESARELFELREIHLPMAEDHQSVADTTKSQLMKMLGDAEFGRLDGANVVTWKADKNGKRTMRFMDRSA